MINIRWGSRDPDTPLIVIFQGAHDPDITAFARYLPDGAAYAVVRPPPAGPIDPGRAFGGWLDEQGVTEVPVVLVGVGSGAAFAGELLFADPARFCAAALLYGTLPFDAGLPLTRGRLAGVPVFLAHGVLPAELARRTWDYLARESGSPLWAQWEPTGHELTANTVSLLGRWIEARLGYLQRHPRAVHEADRASWLSLPEGRLPARFGEPPEVSVTTPQQQQSQNAPADLQEALFSRIMQVDRVETAPSAVSVPGARAFVLPPGDARGPDEAFIVPDLGEFAHLHPRHDGSLHLVLPITLAHDALTQGRAVAHPLAGLRLAAGTVMIFGPRDAAELDVVTGIVRASHMYAAGGASQTSA